MRVEPRYLPADLSLVVSREALLLYVYISNFCDDGGYCEAVFTAAMSAGLSREEYRPALEELETAGYVTRHTHAGHYGNVVGCFVVGYSAPLDLERLSPGAWQRLRVAVFERDDHTCRYCGERSEELECDHVIPISRGGTNEMGNLVTACSVCNSSKRAKLISEWRASHAAGAQ